MIRLQLALDCIDLDHALAVIGQARGLVDIFEVGTPLLLRRGVEAIRRIREAYPDLEILADTKIVDGGYEEADLAFSAGADIVTVLAMAPEQTLAAVCRCASERKGRVAADLISVERPGDRLPALAAAGIGRVCLHRPSDSGEWKRGDSEAVAALQELLAGFEVMIAGGMGSKNLDLVRPLHPDILVVGGAIVGAANPAEAARDLRRAWGDTAPKNEHE